MGERVLTEGLQMIRASASVSSFLAGGGVYTGMRTVNKNAIFSFKEHLERLRHVSDAEDPEKGVPFSLSDVEGLITPLVEKEMRRFLEDHADAYEMKVTAAPRLRKGVKADDASFDDVEALVYVQSLGERPGDAVSVQCMTVGGRTNPTVKHGRWVEERKALEAQQRDDCNEVVLLDDQERVLEGMSSNVVVVDDESGTVITAPADLTLEGTVLKLLLRVCEEHSFPVRRECPTLAQLKQGSVMVTSTSRLALPVNALYLPDGQKVALPFSERAALIAQLVRQDFVNH